MGRVTVKVATRRTRVVLDTRGRCGWRSARVSLTHDSLPVNGTGRAGTVPALVTVASPWRPTSRTRMILLAVTVAASESESDIECAESGPAEFW